MEQWLDTVVGFGADRPGRLRPEPVSQCRLPRTPTQDALIGNCVISVLFVPPRVRLSVGATPACDYGFVDQSFALATVVSFLSVLMRKIPFLGVAGQYYVLEGKPKMQHRISTVDQCQAVCSRQKARKAYAFRKREHLLLLFAGLGEPRGTATELYSSGLPSSRRADLFQRSRPSVPPRPVLCNVPGEVHLIRCKGQGEPPEEVGSRSSGRKTADARNWPAAIHNRLVMYVNPTFCPSTEPPVTDFDTPFAKCAAHRIDLCHHWL